MKTIKRVVPVGQLAILRHELEEAGATDIDWTPAGSGYVEVTATMPADTSVTRKVRVTRWFRPPF